MIMVKQGGIVLVCGVFNDKLQVMKEIQDILKSQPLNTLHIYQRVSTEIQKTQGGILDTQLKNGIKTAKKMKMDWMVWDEGAKSGSRNQEDRIVFNNLMLEVKQGNVKNIFFQDITRSQRSFEYEYYLIKTCKDFDCDIYDLGRKYDLNNPQDNFFLRLQSLFGQYENQQRRQRSVLGKRDHFLRGGWRGGITPFGFDTIDRKLEINKEESKWVKKMFEMYASGETPTDISNLFFSKGVKPRKSVSGIFNIATIQMMLKNEIYYGVDRMKDPDEPEKILAYKGVPKILDKKLFNQVQEQIKSRRKFQHKTGKRKKTTFPVLLRKMIFCDSCGEMWGVRVSIAREQYTYYCRNKENNWSVRLPNREIRKCEVKRSVSIVQTDDLVWRSIIRLNGESHILKEKDKSLILQPINPNQSRSWKQRINYLEKTITGLEDKKSFLYQQFVSGEIDKKMLGELNKGIKKQTSAYQNEIDELQERMEMKLEKDGFIDWVGKRQKRISGMAEITDTKKKQELIKEFVDRVFINHNKETNTFLVRIRLHLPLFNDKLVWKNVKDKKQGYNIKEGSYEIVEEFSVVSGRPKKVKDDEKNKKREPHYL
jgi:DNA invertase Pin-like site-specific DNA recombinase